MLLDSKKRKRFRIPIDFTDIKRDYCETPIEFYEFRECLERRDIFQNK